MSEDVDTLARTLWGEARGDGRAGMQAVACVAMNRLASKARWWKQHVAGIPDNTVAAVCRKPWQFSCWNEGDPNRPKLAAATRADPMFALAIEIAEQAIAGTLRDPTGGATSYYAAAVERPPAWASGQIPCARIGRHLFFRV